MTSPDSSSPSDRELTLAELVALLGGRICSSPSPLSSNRNL